MTRQFITVDYEATLQQTVTLAECLPTAHLARFIVGIIAQLDLTAIYAGYAAVGGAAFAPELLLGLLFYGYAADVFSSHKIEKATYDSIPFRFLAGGRHPDHDTLAHFRKTFLPQIRELFVQVLLVAADLGVLNNGQCLDRRIADKATLEKAVAAWEKTRNERRATVNWRFTGRGMHQTEVALSIT